MRPLLVAATLLAVLAGGGVASAREASLLPYALRLEVRWGEEPGSEEFRRDVERSLALAVSRTCVKRVVTGATEPEDDVDLVLVATLSRFLEETTFDDNVAAAVAPGEPTHELRKAAHLEVWTDGRVATRTGDVPVAAKTFRTVIDYRPRYVGEDPYAAARSLAVDKIVEEAKRSLCRGDEKLDKKIRAALADAAPDAPPR